MHALGDKAEEISSHMRPYSQYEIKLGSIGQRIVEFSISST